MARDSLKFWLSISGHTFKEIENKSIGIYGLNGGASAYSTIREWLAEMLLDSGIIDSALITDHEAAEKTIIGYSPSFSMSYASYFNAHINRLLKTNGLSALVVVDTNGFREDDKHVIYCNTAGVYTEMKVAVENNLPIIVLTLVHTTQPPASPRSPSYGIRKILFIEENSKAIFDIREENYRSINYGRVQIPIEKCTIIRYDTPVMIGDDIYKIGDLFNSTSEKRKSFTTRPTGEPSSLVNRSIL